MVCMQEKRGLMLQKNLTIQLISENRSFQGWQKRYQHSSTVLNCNMHFSIYLPEQLGKETFPVLYWLSGLTCTDENFTQKSGFQRIASELKMIVVAPDTSPRGERVANDESYDLGQGAGFYLNATQNPWKSHYHMYDYIVDELPKLINYHFPTNGQQAISGHSMGGHGALSIGLKKHENYSSISAFSPIVNPMNVPWGKKAFCAYLGENREDWLEYDSCELLKKYASSHLPAIKISQGMSDNFLVEQLKPRNFVSLAKEMNIGVSYHEYEHFDHSYFFIASFIEDHLRFHKENFK